MVRSDNRFQIISVYHSPRIRRASTAINHYYPDRTHSRRVPHSSPSRRSFIHARPVTVVPRESARGCLSTPPAIITSLYIIISQWTILFVNNLLAFTIRGNNLKLRNHSRELIMGPHACPLARYTSRRPRHVHVVHWAYFRLFGGDGLDWGRKGAAALLYPFLFRDLLSLSYSGNNLRGVD